jgi:hypothetical protein
MTSIFVPLVIVLHCSHLLQGFTFDSRVQLTTLAKILAAEVFPVPLGPEKRKA